MGDRHGRFRARRTISEQIETAEAQIDRLQAAIPDMIAAGIRVLVESGVLDHGAGRKHPTGADEALVTDIYRAMVQARGDATDDVVKRA
jgi:hypothetical protein